MASGYKIPNITVVTKVNQRAIRRFFFMQSSDDPQIGQQNVDELDSDKRRNDSTQAVN